MEKPNVVISYGFAGRRFHAYLVRLDQICRDLGVVNSTCQLSAELRTSASSVESSKPTAHA